MRLQSLADTSDAPYPCRMSDDSSDVVPSWIKHMKEALQTPGSSEYRQLQEFVDRVKPHPALRQFKDFVDQVRGPMETLRRATASAVTQALGPRPHDALAELSRRVKESARWMQQVPETLRIALAGKVVIHQDLTLRDVRAIERAFQDGGEIEAIQTVHDLHAKLFEDGEFRERLVERWREAGRGAIIGDVLSALDAGFFYVVVPAALAQVDGIVAKYFNLPGLKFPELKRRISALHEEGDLYGPLVNDFLEDLLDVFEHGKPTAQLNRHAVLHGGDTAYGSRQNAVTAIVWADYVLGLTLQSERSAEPPAAT
jgi:hypothetical protein